MKVYILTTGPMDSFHGIYRSEEELKLVTEDEEFLEWYAGDWCMVVEDV